MTAADARFLKCKLLCRRGDLFTGQILKGSYTVGRAAVADRGGQGVGGERWTHITVLGLGWPITSGGGSRLWLGQNFV